MANIAEIVTARQKVSGEISKMKAKHKKELEKLEGIEARLEQAVFAYLTENGLQNVKVDGVATAFKTKQYTASVANWDVTWSWIVENERYDLLNQAVNKKVVKAIADDTGTVVPGVNFNVVDVVQFRSAPGTGDAGK